MIFMIKRRNMGEIINTKDILKNLLPWKLLEIHTYKRV